MPAAHSQPTALAQGWNLLSQLHERIQVQIEEALQTRHALSVREYSLLAVLSRQYNGPGGHLHMKQVADAVVLSQSATTRLVTRLEERGLLARFLCPTDRRGIYTHVTAAGAALIKSARPTHDAALVQALSAARADPQFASLIQAIENLRCTR